MKMPSICVDFLKLRTAGENFVRAHRLNVADDALAHSCYALAVAFSAFLHHRRDCIPAQAIAVPLPEKEPRALQLFAYLVRLTRPIISTAMGVLSSVGVIS